MKKTHKMSNYCFSTLVLKGPKAVLKDIVEHGLDFQHYVPVTNEDMDGRRKLWGTRSSPLDLELQYQPAHDPYTLHAKFMTAWSPPVAFLEALLKRFPDLWIKLEFEIEGGLGCGLWICWQENGVPVEKCMLWNEPVFSDSNSESESESSESEKIRKH